MIYILFLSISCAIIFILSIPLIIIIYLKWRFQYWKNMKIACVAPTFPFGNIENPSTTKTPVCVLLQRVYNKFKSKGYTFGGFYIIASPQFLPISPEIIKHIMTRDFSHFVNRGMYYNEIADPISAHLFSIEGDKWKNLRAKLTPTFTTGKIKMMIQTIIDCGRPLRHQLDMLCVSKKEFNIREFLCCYTTDLIGSCAFGIDCNTFTTTDSAFRKHCNTVISPKIVDAIKINFCLIFPRVARYFNVPFTEKEAANFFMNIVKETVNYRLENNITRNDFMQLLMELKDGNGEGLTIEQMAAQAFVIFLAGFETSSTTMTFCLYELCKNQTIQETLRTEINDVLEKHGGVNYHSIGEMKYLNQVIEETLRKYPPLPILNRISTKDYNIANTNITLEKGTRVAIPVYALHHDEEYFPDPDKFDPNRFSEENKPKIVPYTYLPFGDGPRGCIGLRFGMTQTQVGLATLIRDYKFILNNKTESPLVLDPLAFILTTSNVIYLNVEKVQK